MEPVTVSNVLDVSFEDMRSFCFSLVGGHESVLTMDRDFVVARLGEYASLYQYFSEMYTLLVGKVREATELKAGYRKVQFMDKRDCLEQVLKVVKFQYDSLSRKVTVISGDEDA